MKELGIEDIRSAAQRLNGKLIHTPVLQSSQLNDLLGHEFYFKCENFQHIGAFKARGALNTLLWLKEQNRLPEKVVAYSSGNHAQAVAWACKQLGVKAQIFMPGNVSKVKSEGTRALGAELTFTSSRQEAEALADEAQLSGAYLVPPYDHDQVICGQGTAALEAMEALGGESVDAVFVPIGGGGLATGTLLAVKGFKPKINVIAGEPEAGNDAIQSLRSGAIVRLKESPDTLADGARTLSLSPRTFHYLKKLDDYFEVTEEEILEWTQKLIHFVKVQIEPTSALPMAAAVKWLKCQDQPKKVLVLLSGGNMDLETHRKIWETSYI
ncbi:MAG: serine/threonine dehydratase [Bdellovibrionaceae bacterium]|nr:serine/threonine dehydratase [Pseudobdellovibrionaceae bacterium]|tara:strand:+ start:47793 stop:48767 length:975 start_codon:yes stop_codon:yes gene_type:complete